MTVTGIRETPGGPAAGGDAGAGALGPIDGYASVRTWMDDYRRHHGDGEDMTRSLDRLAAFCTETGVDPDTIVGECIRTLEDGQHKIRLKKRREYIALIDAYEARAGRKSANAVRSFLMHNGVALSASVVS